MSESLDRGRFWLVWRENGGTPTRPHASKADAEREAQRLARSCPGSIFYVMKVVGGFAAGASPMRKVNFVEDDGIPF